MSDAAEPSSPTALLARSVSASLAAIPEAAHELFGLLARGREAISAGEFERCARCLAQLSGDFEVAPASSFERIDLSGDGLVQHDEFLEEVSRISELVGARATLESLRGIRADVRGEQAAAASDASSQGEGESSAEEDRPTGNASSSAAPASAPQAAASKPAAKSAVGSRSGKKKPEGKDKKRKEDGPKSEQTRTGKTKAHKATANEKTAARPPAPAAAAPAAAAAPPSPASQPKRPRAIQSETVRCEKTLEFGKPIRNAICIGREVWTVDWQGSVTIRDRDDASKVKGEVPTNRFVWSMLHMKPGLMWMGQEAHGISLFSSKKQESVGLLTGGHTGGVTCLVADDFQVDEEGEAEFPQRKAWSGSNDFTIRQWLVETWRQKDRVPDVISRSSEAVVADLGRWRMGVVRGASLYGHENGVKSLLKIGPVLWSGSDDGTIRLWSCTDSECFEVVKDAHHGAVSQLKIVLSGVWSAGSDGLIKEWSIGGTSRRCLRQVAPAGCEKGVYAILPVGRDVWVCGHQPSIQIFSKKDMQPTSEEDGHKPYVSNLIAVDRVETKVVWSTSFGDRKLKVWKHTVRGEEASVDELQAANLLYQEQQQSFDARLSEYTTKIELLEGQASEVEREHRRQLDDLAHQLSEEKARSNTLETERKRLQCELERLEEAFRAAGLASLFADPGALRVFLERAARLEETLRKLGLDHLLDHPEELGRLLSTMTQLQSILKRTGFGSVLQDPTLLEGVLSRYTALKRAFEAHDFAALFEDSHLLDRFLGTYKRVRTEFSRAGETAVLEDAEAARRFLSAHKEDKMKLEALQEELARLRAAKGKLAASEEELTERLAAAEAALRERDAQLAGMSARAKALAADLESCRARADSLEEQVNELEGLVEQYKQEREEALERERLMSIKYKELDIFKLDVIARELKGLDNELGLLGSDAKGLRMSAGRLRSNDEQLSIMTIGDKMLEECKRLRAHIRDVIHQCLSETQKMHIGVAIDDHLHAGELQEGGSMATRVVEEVTEEPDHGNSNAAKLRQRDEVSGGRLRHAPGPGQRRSRPPSPSPGPGPHW